MQGDTIVCGYHGFTYGADGRCVAVPGQQRIPRTARVGAYPVAERDSLVWVWIGDPDRADPGLIPRAPWLADDRYATVRGMEPLAARYELLVDNLLDLSHETYLHGGYIGTPEVADTPITTEADEEAGTVRVSRRMDDAACPPFYAQSTGITGRIVRWQDIEYHPPCLYLLHSRVAPAGVAARGRTATDPDGFHVEMVYAITPSTATTTLTSGRWPGTSRWAMRRWATFLHDSNRTVVHAGRGRTEHPRAGDRREPGRGARNCQHQHRHRRAGRPADAGPDGGTGGHRRCGRWPARRHPGRLVAAAR